MSEKAVIVSTLKNDATIQNLIGNRIYSIWPASWQGLPLAIFFEITTLHVGNLDHTEGRWQVSFFGDPHSTAVDVLTERARALFHKKTFTTDDKNYGCWVDAIREISEESDTRHRLLELRFLRLTPL